MKDITHFNDDWFAAKKNRDKVADSCFGMLQAALVNKRIEFGHALSNDEMIAVLKKQIKQTKESLDFAKKANREDLIAKHSREIAILEEYVPAQMSFDDVKNALSGVVTVGMNKGQAMKAAMAILRGKADGKVISDAVSSIING